MSYLDQWALESKLNNKADKWEMQNLSNKVNKLENENSRLKTAIGELEAVSNNRRQILYKLLDLLIESRSIEETNQLNEMKNYV